ncbi:MAG TPA: hypothetical protein VHO06_09525 [Polyangia bacterium]|nr:hypothetical protein [Polyangia bacterium]
MDAVERALALRAFEQGFSQGADPLHGRRRHRLEPATHAHWKRGIEAGIQAAQAAREAFARELGE